MEIRVRLSLSFKILLFTNSTRVLLEVIGSVGQVDRRR